MTDVVVRLIDLAKFGLFLVFATFVVWLLVGHPVIFG